MPEPIEEIKRKKTTHHAQEYEKHLKEVEKAEKESSKAPEGRIGGKKVKKISPEDSPLDKLHHPFIKKER